MFLQKRAAVLDATWVMQGWMFGYQRDIWDYETLAAHYLGARMEETLKEAFGNIATGKEITAQEETFTEMAVEPYSDPVPSCVELIQKY